MNEVLKEWGQYISVVGVGVVVTIVKMLNTPNIGKRSIFDRAMIFLTGAVTSGFFCWMGFEFALYATGAQEPSLAMGGFVAWKGGEWVTTIIDKFINIKILGTDESENDNDK